MNNVKGLLLSTLVLLLFLGVDVAGQASRTATALATVVNGFVVSITVTDGGAGYTAAPDVKITGGSGSGAAAVATISNGVVNRVIVTDAGSGYTTSPLVVISSPPANRTATATATVVNGFIVSVKVTDGGSGYTAPPSVAISGGSGTGAVAQAIISIGSVTQIIVQNAGSGYSSTAAVTIGPPPSGKPPLSDGLIAYYPFNGNAKDESGNGYDGAITGAVLVADRFGNPNAAYHFAQASSHIDVPIDFKNSQNVTLCAWAAFDSTQTRLPVMFSREGWGGGLALDYDFGVDAFLFGVGPGVTDTGFDVLRFHKVVSMNEWYFVVGTCDGAVMRLYLNGTLVASLPHSMGIFYEPTYRTWIGNDNFSGAHPMGGTLDEIRIYSRAISDAEVLALYKYESLDSSYLTIEVKSIRVNLFLKPGKTYQLESSTDLKTWTKLEQIVATDANVTRDFDVSNTGRYFRVYELTQP